MHPSDHTYWGLYFVSGTLETTARDGRSASRMTEPSTRHWALNTFWISCQRWTSPPVFQPANRIPSYPLNVEQTPPSNGKSKRICMHCPICNMCIIFVILEFNHVNSKFCLLKLFLTQCNHVMFHHFICYYTVHIF